MRKHWIVLVNKSPRGPLTFEEVSALLSEKIISRTDLALVVSAENSEEKADWKFLWQYPEFDLRAKKTEDSPLPIENKLEQRKPQNSDQIKAQISESLPDEIAMISPEDLLVSVKKGRVKGPAPLAFADTEEEDSLPYSSASPGNAKWGYAVLGLFILMVGGWVKSTFFETLEPETSTKSANVVRAPAKANMPVGTPKMARPESPKSTVTPRNLQAEKPSEGTKSVNFPGKKEISLDEYQKMKEANAAKERAQEEEQRRQNEDAENLANAKGEEGEDSGGEADEGDRERNVEVPLKKRLKNITLKDLKKRKVAEDAPEGQEQESTQENRSDEPQRDSEREEEGERDR